VRRDVGRRARRESVGGWWDGEVGKRRKVSGRRRRGELWEMEGRMVRWVRKRKG
jgi:hypothetical protein